MQVSLARVALTDLFFILKCLNSDGKDIRSMPAPVQEQFQKVVVILSPRDTAVEALKRAMSSSSHGS